MILQPLLFMRDVEQTNNSSPWIEEAQFIISSINPSQREQVQVFSSSSPQSTHHNGSRFRYSVHHLLNQPITKKQVLILNSINHICASLHHKRTKSRHSIIWSISLCFNDCINYHQTSALRMESTISAIP